MAENDGQVYGAAPPSDNTVLLEESDEKQEPILSLVSLNARTAATYDIARGTVKMLPELQEPTAGLRTVTLSCGRDAANKVVVSDSRVSLIHFTLHLRAARSGQVCLELIDQSSNGTWVNGRRVGKDRSVPLAVGDRVVVLPARVVGPDNEIGFLLLHEVRSAQNAPTSQTSQTEPVTPEPQRRTQTPPLSSSSSPSLSPSTPHVAALATPSELERDLRCGICADAIFKCLTLVPCGHNFCSVCFVRWRRTSPKCPECRENAMQAVRNISVDRVVETFVKAHPEAARSEEELAELKKFEKDPQNVTTLRWLLREGPAFRATRNSDPMNVATPLRQTSTTGRQTSTTVRQTSHRRPSQQSPPQSAACSIS